MPNTRRPQPMQTNPVMPQSARGNRSADEVAEELLVLQAKGGESDALARLVGVWSPRLMRHAGRWLADPNAAADAVQEAWIAIARSLGQLDDAARFPAWAFRITQNKCVDLVRTDARHAAATRRSATQPRPQDSRDADADDAVAQMRVALGQLDPERRALLGLHYMDGLTVSQLAEVFSLPSGTVKSRLFHARNELKQIMLRATTHEEGELQ